MSTLQSTRVFIPSRLCHAIILGLLLVSSPPTSIYAASASPVPPDSPSESSQLPHHDDIIPSNVTHITDSDGIVAGNGTHIHHVIGNHEVDDSSTTSTSTAAAAAIIISSPTVIHVITVAGASTATTTMTLSGVPLDQTTTTQEGPLPPLSYLSTPVYTNIMDAYEDARTAGRHVHAEELPTGVPAVPAFVGFDVVSVNSGDKSGEDGGNGEEDGGEHGDGYPPKPPYKVDVVVAGKVGERVETDM